MEWEGHEEELRKEEEEEEVRRREEGRKSEGKCFYEEARALSVEEVARGMMAPVNWPQQFSSFFSVFFFVFSYSMGLNQLGREEQGIAMVWPAGAKPVWL